MTLLIFTLLLTVGVLGWAWTAFQLSFDLLPIFAGVSAGSLAHRHGLGLIGAMAVGLGCMIGLLICSTILGTPSRLPARLGVAALLASIAAALGYSFGSDLVADLALPIAQLPLITAVVVGGVVGVRALTIKAEPEDDMTSEAQPEVAADAQ